MELIHIRAYIGALVAFCIMDGLWLGLVATDLYSSALGDLLREKPNWSAAIIFYLGYIVGVVYFVIRPSLNSGGARTAFRDGALLGLLTYATYDMTNLATIVGWPTGISVVDMIWGIIITGTSSLVGYLFASRPAFQKKV